VGGGGEGVRGIDFNVKTDLAIDNIKCITSNN
jgi:hypothetical protein